MTTFTDTILFFVNGVQQQANSGDTISISRNLTIASPSTFSVGVNLTFASGFAPTVSQTSTSTTSGSTLTVQAQGATGATHNGGNLNLSSGTSGSATVGTVNIQTGGTTNLAISPTVVTITDGLTQSGGAVSLTGNTASTFTTSSGNNTIDAAATLNLGNSTATSIAIGKSGVTTTVTGSLSQQTGALNLTANAASQITTSSGGLTITAAGASTWSTSSNALTITSASGATWSTASGNLTLTGASSLNLNAVTSVVFQANGATNATLTGGQLQWSNNNSSLVINQAATSSGTGANFTIQAQTSNTTIGGQLILASGAGDVATDDGTITMKTGAATQLTINPTTITMGSGANNTSTVHQVGGTTNLTITSGQLQWASNISSPKINQAAAVASGTPLAIVAQSAGGSNNSGGNLILESGAATGTGADGYILFETGTSNTVQAFVSAPLTGLMSTGGLGIGSTPGTDPTITRGTGTPTSTQPNGSIFLRTDGTSSTAIYTRQSAAWSTISSAPSGSAGGDLSGTYPNPTVAAISGTSPIVITPSNLQWTTGTTTPKISQADNTTNSSNGAVMTIQAQNATGTTSTGGNLNLSSGTGTSSAGLVNLVCGGSGVLTISSITVTIAVNSFQWSSSQTPSINQAQQTANIVGKNMSITAQQGQAANNTQGGNLILSSGAGGGTGTAGDLLLEHGGTAEAFITANASGTGFGIGTTPGTDPTITRGTGVPATTQPNGSIFLRTDGTSSTGVYTRQAGAWSALGGSGGGGSLTAPVTGTVITNTTHPIYTIDTTGGGSDYIIIDGYASGTTLTGTVTVSNNSTAVTGSGTSFSTQVTVGGYILFGNDPTVYTIKFITSNTALILSSSYQGTSSSPTTIAYAAKTYLLPAPSNGRLLIIKNTTTPLASQGAELNPINIAPHGVESIDTSSGTANLSGTFNISNGSASVTPTSSQVGTVYPGNSIVFSTQPTVSYIVAKVSDNGAGTLNITLTSNYTGTGTSANAIINSLTYNTNLGAVRLVSDGINWFTW